MGTTVFANVSTPGPAGPPGPAGYAPQFIVASGAPSNSVGNIGDMYIDSATGNVYGPKATGGWGSIACNIKGATGATGATGPAGYAPQYIVAAGPPSGGTGNNGDMYINSSTSDVYGPKTSGAWGSIVCNIKGSTGAQGPPGVAYTPRGAWSSSTTYAQGDEVTYSSQLYISLQSGNLNNVPSSSPTYWQLVGSGASQTPWLSDIDGNSFLLKNPAKISINLPFATAPYSRLHVRAGASGVAAALNADTVVFGEHSSNAYYEIVAAAGKQCGLVFGGNAQTNSSNIVDSFDGTNHALTIAANTAGAYMTFCAGGGAERMRITSAGLVGIGTTGPSSNLHVNGPAGANATVRITAPSGYWGGLQFENAGVSSPLRWALYMGSAGGTGSSLSVYNYVNTNDSLTIASTGKVGINNANPGSLLFVGNGTMPVATLAGLNVNLGGGPTFISVSDGTASTYMGSDSAYGGLIATLTNHALLFRTNNAERMRIDTAGKVGIASAAPVALLHVLGAIAAPSLSADNAIVVIGGIPGNQLGIGSYNAAPYGFWFQGKYQGNDGISTYPIVLNPLGGSVGIGQSTPVAPLNVRGPYNTPSGTADRAICVIEGTDDVQLCIGADGNSPYGMWMQTKNRNNGGSFYSLALEPAGGFVAIGSLNPSCALDVTGAIKASLKHNVFGTASGVPSALASTDANICLYDFTGGNWAGIGTDANGRMWFRTGTSGSPDARMIIDINGNVGIGPTVPTCKLDIAGDCNLSAGSVYRVNGVPISTGGAITTQVAQSTSARQLGVSYQNTTGKPMMITVSVTVAASVSGASSGGIDALTDASNPPTTIVAYQMQYLASGAPQAEACVTFWVLPGNWFKVAASANGSPTISANWWTEWY